MSESKVPASRNVISLSFDNINADDTGDAVPGYGVDHVAVAEGLGCKAIRVKSPNEFKDAFAKARKLMEEHRVPVVLEFILERVTNIAMGQDVDSVSEFEDVLCLDSTLTLESGWVSMDPDDADAAEESA